jgi:hypothetical protein
MEKPRTTWKGRVQKIIKPPHASIPEMAEITVPGASELYRELRIENTLTDGNGKTRKLREDVDVVLTIEADLTSTVPNDDEML